MLNARQQRATNALRTLLEELGLKQREVAQRIGTGASYVSHIKRLDIHPEFYVSESRASALERAIDSVKRERALALLNPLPIAVSETANDTHVAINQEIRDQAADAVRSGLAAALANGTTPSFSLPSGVGAVMADMGPNLSIFAVSDRPSASSGGKQGKKIRALKDQINRYRLLIHELQHKVDELEEKHPRKIAKLRADY